MDVHSAVNHVPSLPNQPPSTTPLLSIRGLCKSYAAPILQEIDLDLLPGEVHALMGANGAGKSTLARIISGLAQPGAGTLTLEGEAYRPTRKSDAEARGVQIVQQELTLIPTLSVAENLFLSRLPSRWGLVRSGELRRQARVALAEVGLDDLEPASQTAQLGIGEQQLVEIARALTRSCRVLILDEPTAALSSTLVERLFRHVARLRAAGVAIVYISHRLEEVRRIANRISVLRDGRLVATRSAEEIDLNEAVRLMVGANPQDEMRPHHRSAGPIAMRVDRISRGSRVREVSLELHRGEVLGISGLVGSGRTELLRAIYGADRADSGAVFLGGAPRPWRSRSPKEAVARGIGMVPEDRKSEGLMLSLSVRTNFTLPRIAGLARGPAWIDRARERALAQSLAEQVQLRCHSLDQPAQELSGGNQQKVLIGRSLTRDPEILLLDEPTRGVDVGAKFAIYHLIDNLAAQGKGLIVVSSELDELMLICDRIGVMSAGRLVKIFRRGEWSREKLLTVSFEGYSGSRPPGGEGES
jgi:ribose transport system ATP-binding protein